MRLSLQDLPTLLPQLRDQQQEPFPPQVLTGPIIHRGDQSSDGSIPRDAPLLTSVFPHKFQPGNLIWVNRILPETTIKVTNISDVILWTLHTQLKPEPGSSKPNYSLRPNLPSRQIFITYCIQRLLEGDWLAPSRNMPPGLWGRSSDLSRTMAAQLTALQVARSQANTIVLEWYFKIHSTDSSWGHTDHFKELLMATSNAVPLRFRTCQETKIITEKLVEPGE